MAVNGNKNSIIELNLLGYFRYQIQKLDPESLSGRFRYDFLKAKTQYKPEIKKQGSQIKYIMLYFTIELSKLQKLKTKA